MQETKADRIRQNSIRAAQITGIPAALLEAMTYTLDESQGRYPVGERAQAAHHLIWMNDRYDPRGYEPGSFTRKLIVAWGNADNQNSARLCLGFPIYGDAFDQIKTYGYDGLARWAGIETEKP